jgi:ketosteroid isomerase-like protein
MIPATARDCLNAFEAALGRMDMDGVLALLTDDVVFFYSNGSAHWGREAIRDAIQENWDKLDRDNYATRDHVWLAESDGAAVCAYSFAWSAIMDGREVGGRGRGTIILRREPQGWRIASEHLSQGRWKPKA